MSKIVSIIGGDLRIAKLAKIIRKQGIQIKTYGLENSNEILEQEKCNLEECVSEGELIISSIPLTKDKKILNAPFAKSNVEIEYILNKIKNKKFISGKIYEEYIKKYSSIEFIDLLQDEELTILNSIPSAEGAIQVAMEETEITLNNSKILIMGFGRIGKILANMLSGFGAQIYCEARKQTDIAWIQSYGYNPILLEQLDNKLNEFDIIFNTIPYLILDEKKLKLLKSKCLIVDLASTPGGVDFEKAKELQLKVIWALGLPGKVAPETSAKYIYEILKKYIE